MSYDITLRDPVTHEVIEFDEPHQMKGGMYAIGGTKEAWLNITYNYANYYYDATEGDDRFFGKLWYDEPKNLGIRGIYGKTGAESIPMLQEMVERIKPMPDEECPADCKGYWKPTAENAVRPLHYLIAMAKMRPDGIWDGD